MKRGIVAILAITVLLSLSIHTAMANSSQDVYQTMNLMAQKLMAKQLPDGRFEGPFEADPGFELLTLVLINQHERRDLKVEQAFIKKAVDTWLGAEGFGAYPRGPYDHDVTGLVLISIEELGYPLKDFGLQRLKTKFEAFGGREKLNLGTKMLLSPMGLATPAELEKFLRPALLKLPSFLSVSVKKLGIFRSLLIPLVSWNYLRKIKDPNKATSKAVKDGIQWILDHQMPDGSWYTVFNTIVNIGALKEAQRLGFGNYEQNIKRALKAIKGWRTKNYSGQMVQQLTLTNGWDTPQSLIAMSEIPKEISQKYEFRIDDAIEFLDANQVTVQGDWSINSPHLVPGGWSFIVTNTDYPDTDVVAAVLESKHAFPQVSSDETFEKGLNWLMSLQNSDGGFPAWEKGVSRLGSSLIQTMFEELPDFSDLSQADVTSRIARLLHKLKDSHNYSTREKRRIKRAISRSCQFIKSQRIGGTYWKGRWLVAYLYGTSEAIDTLATTGCEPVGRLEKSVAWLVNKQNADGGFGEDHEAFRIGHYVGRSSTVMQTSYVVHGLISFEEAYYKLNGKRSSYYPALQKAMSYLIAQANKGNGFIPERSFTGVIGAKLWYSDYSLSPQFMTLRALGRYYRLVF